MHWQKKTVILLAASFCFMIPFLGAANAEMPIHDPGPGITLNKGTDADSIWQVSNAWGSDAHAEDSGIGATLQQGPHINLFSRKNGGGSRMDRPAVAPGLGSFILIGFGLLTLAGWGKRKLRR